MLAKLNNVDVDLLLVLRQTLHARPVASLASGTVGYITLMSYFQMLLEANVSLGYIGS